MFFFDTCNAVAAREDQKPKYWRLGRSHLGLSLTLWPHNVKREILNMTCDCWFSCSCVYWSLVKARKIVWESHGALHSWKHFEFDVVTSNSIQDGGALVINILVFDLRVQLQHYKCLGSQRALFIERICFAQGNACVSWTFFLGATDLLRFDLTDLTCWD